MPRTTLVAVAALACLTSHARAWEVVGGSLPTFAQETTPASASLIRPWSAMTGDPFRATTPPAGYDLSLGKGLLLGVRNWSDTPPGLAAAGLSRMGFSGNQAKLGFDLGGGLTPYVSVGLGEFRAPFASNSSLTGAGPAGLLAAPGNPFSSSASVTTLGAGFDYALTNNITIGFGVSATQVRPNWP
jgi:opacity protein-like surface antigen